MPLRRVPPRKAEVAPVFQTKSRSVPVREFRGTHLEIRGLMAIPPFSEDTEAARPYFRRLRQLRDELAKASGLRLDTLSMGMSHDFEVAIEEGSTCVRIGMAIFGERPRH